MPSGGGGGQTTQQTTVQDNSPWKEQQPFLTKQFGAASSLYDKGYPKSYTGQTLAGFDPTQKLAQQLTINTARNNPITNAASAQFLKTMNGDYLSPDSNPWLKSN